jgi:hypothetical protein
MLNAVGHDAEVTILDEPMRVTSESDPKVELAFHIESVEPIAVVEVTVDDARLVNRHGGLVNHVVVEIGDHGAPSRDLP